MVISSESPAGNLKVLCQRLRRGAKKSPTTSCSRKTTSDRDLCSSSSSKNPRRAKLKSSGEKSGDESNRNTQDNTKSPWLEWCSFCQSKNLYCSVSVPRPGSERTDCKSCSCREETEGTSAMHLDGSNCPCTCATCCWTIPDVAYDLLRQCLHLDPQKRVSAAEALEHPFFEE